LLALAACLSGRLLRVRLGGDSACSCAELLHGHVAAWSGCALVRWVAVALGGRVREQGLVGLYYPGQAVLWLGWGTVALGSCAAACAEKNIKSFG